MDEANSSYWSRNLQLIRVKSFINRFHLVLHTCVEILNVTFFTFTGFTGWEALNVQDLRWVSRVWFPSLVRLKWLALLSRRHPLLQRGSALCIPTAAGHNPHAQT